MAESYGLINLDGHHPDADSPSPGPAAQPSLPMPRQKFEGVDEYGRTLTKYEREVESGRRRSNGSLKLRKLNHRHYSIVGMHLAGWSGGAIAVQLGCTQATISRILNDPLVQEIIEESYGLQRKEILALTGKAIAAVREGFQQDTSLSTKFKAIDQLAKVKDIAGVQEKTRTAEDLVQELLSNKTVQQINIQVNNADIADKASE